MTVTEAAQNKVNQVLNGEGFLEVCLEGGGCSGYQIKLKGTSEIPSDAIRHNLLRFCLPGFTGGRCNGLE